MPFQVSVPYHQHNQQLDIPDDIVWTADDPKKDVGESMGVTSRTFSLFSNDVFRCTDADADALMR